METGVIIDYFGSRELSLAVVVKGSEERFQVKCLDGHLDKVTPKQVLCVHECPAGKTAENALPAIQQQITATASEIDMDLLCGDIREQGGAIGLHQMCADYFGDESALSLSAMARKLSEDTLLFKRVGYDFAMRTEEEIAEITRLKQLRAEKAAMRERLLTWVRTTVLQAPKDAPVSVPEEYAPFIRQLQDFLLLGKHSDSVTLLASLPSKLPARTLSLQILKKSGSFPEGADEFLLENGIHAGFDPDVLKEAENLPEYVPDPQRVDESSKLIFSIDDAETRDIDDALSCEVLPDGNLRVGVYIADPASFIEKDSLLDQAAVDRPLSMYLPTMTVPMFPEVVSFDHASLKQGIVRPVLAFHITYSPDGEQLDWEIVSAQACVSHRLTYEEADELIANGTGALAEALRSLSGLSRQLWKFREEDGAVTLNRPEMHIRVRNDEITITHQETDTPSHRLVSELMILINNLAARYALVNDIPVIYRAQEKPSEPVCSVFRYEPCLFDQQVRKMRRTHLSTYPAPHFGLGLDLYTQVSSPLRRYADLIIQRQLSAHLRGLPLPYKQEELFTVLDNVDGTSAQNKTLERQANLFWTLEYLRRNCIGEEFDATIVRQEGPLTLAEIDEYFVRGVVYTRDSLRIGERIRLRIKDALPKDGRLMLEVAE